jgi:hypothetical protein
VKYILLILIVVAEHFVFCQRDCDTSNYCCTLAKALENPKCVKSLYLEDEKLVEDIMLKFSNLEQIELVCCNSGDFLKYAYKFQNLKEIGIQNPGKDDLLRRIPKRSALCKELKMCRFAYFSIKNLPKNIGQMKELESIVLMYCSIKKIPKSISKLSNLKLLRLTRGENENHYPKSEKEKLVKLLPGCKVIID